MAYDKVVDSAFLEAGLTLVGDSIRAKSGTSAKLEFPNGMKAAVDAIDTSENLEDVLTQQKTLITDIKTALEGKAGITFETCTVTFDTTNLSVQIGQTLSESGELIVFNSHLDGVVTTANLAKNTLLYVQTSSPKYLPVSTGDVLSLDSYSNAAVFFVSGDGMITA